MAPKYVQYNRLCGIMIVLLLCNLNAAAQFHKWVTGGGSSFSPPSGYPAQEYVREVTTDDQGNLYVLAETMASGSISFDTLTLSVQTDAGSMYRAKTVFLSYTPQGRIRWGKLLEGANDTRFAGLLYDRGSVYISGTLSGASGPVKRYFGKDTAMYANYYGGWIIKYDTLGKMQWIRPQGENTLAAMAATSNWYNKLLVQDTFIHCVKYIYRSGGELTPAVISKKGIYDYTYSPHGDLLNLVRLPLEDTTLIMNIAAPASLHDASNTLFVSVWDEVSAIHSGVAVFDAARNLVRFDTFSSTSGMVYPGSYASTFRAGNALYTFGTAFGVDCIFRGDTFAFPPGGIAPYGQISFVVKTDTAYNVIWKRALNATEYGSALKAWYGALNKDRLIFTGFGTSVVVGSDTVRFSGTTGKIPIVVIDTNGTLQKIDYWNNKPPFGKLEGGYQVTAHDNDIYIGGAVGDSVWWGGSGYGNKGGPSDFLVLDYSMDCPVAAAAFTYTVAGDTLGLHFSGSTEGLDSVRWSTGTGMYLKGDTATWYYRSSGSFNVCAIAYTPCGNDTSCQLVTVTCAPPAADFIYSVAADTLQLIYSGSLTTDSVRWDFGTGDYANGFSVSHKYRASGTYTVCAVAYNRCGSDTSCQTITVTCTPPRASFVLTQNADSVRTVYGGTGDTDSFAWDFGAGDGITAAGDTAVYHYRASGTYTVCLIAYSSCANDTSCQTVIILSSDGIQETVLHSGIKIYPNPASEVITIEHATPGTVFLLYDAIGRVLQQFSITQDKQTLPVADLSPGLYLLKTAGSEQGAALHFLKR